MSAIRTVTSADAGTPPKKPRRVKPELVLTPARPAWLAVTAFFVGVAVANSLGNMPWVALPAGFAPWVALGFASVVFPEARIVGGRPLVIVRFGSTTPFVRLRVQRRRWSMMWNVTCITADGMRVVIPTRASILSWGRRDSWLWAASHNRLAPRRGSSTRSPFEYAFACVVAGLDVAVEGPPDVEAAWHRAIVNAWDADKLR